MKKLVYTLFLFPLFLVSQDLNVDDDATLTIGTSGSMTINGTLTSNTSGSIIIQTSQANSGSFIAKAGGASQGKGITLARSLDGGDEWALLGVPVTGETSSDVDDNLRTNGGKSAIGHFDPSINNGEFVYYNTNAGTSLTNGKGYLISPSGAQTVSFTGTMSVADVTYDLADETGTYGNWNLIGNPYPSYLHMTDDGGDATNNFLTVNAAAIHDTYEAVYAWDGANYDVYNQTSNTINHIAPGEGFFVYAVAGAATDASFTEAMQTSGQGANFNASVVRNDSQRVSIFKIELKDDLNNESDNLKLYFSDRVTKGLDPGYDAGKFFRGSDSKVFTRLVEEDEGVDLQIQALPYNDLKDLVIPLGITTKSPSLQLSINENSIDHLYRVYLEDRLNNTIVEFNKSIDLSFDDDSKGIGRFYLHFTEGTIPELPTDGDDFRIFKVSNSELRLMGSPETNYNAKVYDFSGRLVREVNFNHQVNISEIDSRGINILTIESNDTTLTKKFKLN
jgi:hypothetical protein